MSFHVSALLSSSLSARRSDAEAVGVKLIKNKKSRADLDSVLQLMGLRGLVLVLMQLKTAFGL